MRILAWQLAARMRGCCTCLRESRVGQPCGLDNYTIELVATMHDEISQLPRENRESTMADALAANFLNLCECGTFPRLHELVLHTNFDRICVACYESTPEA